MIKLKEQKMKKDNKRLKTKRDNKFKEDEEVLEFRKEYEKSMKKPVKNKTSFNTNMIPKSQRGRTKRTFKK